MFSDICLDISSCGKEVAEDFAELCSISSGIIISSGTLVPSL
ncbi:17346_t:CDS:2, partial [Dentiscutata heterogama]